MQDGSQWATALKCSGPLLLLACQTCPPDEDAAWLKDLTASARAFAKVWIAAGEIRRSQAGKHMLTVCSSIVENFPKHKRRILLSMTHRY